MQDHPSARDVLDQAIAHLRDGVLPMLEPRAQFEMRVTLGALQLVRRSMELASESNAAEHARLTALLGEGGDLRALNERLCALIRDGALDLSTPGLAEHLHATALEKLAVDQPTYAAYRRALEHKGQA